MWCVGWGFCPFGPDFIVTPFCLNYLLKYPVYQGHILRCQGMCFHKGVLVGILSSPWQMLNRSFCPLSLDPRQCWVSSRLGPTRTKFHHNLTFSGAWPTAHWRKEKENRVLGQIFPFQAYGIREKQLLASCTPTQPGFLPAPPPPYQLM